MKNLTFNTFYYTSPIVLLWLIIATFYAVNSEHFLLSFALIGLAYKYPKTMIYVLLFSLPMFGNRPSQEQTHYLILISSMITLGIYVKLVLSKYMFKRFKAKLRSNNIVLIFITLWFLVSFLSLIGLPIIGMVKKTFSEDTLYIFRALLGVGETTLYSSVQSVFYSVLAVLVGLYIYGTVRFKNRVDEIWKYFLAIMAGLFFAIVFGHLDYFGIIDLNMYRELDRVSITGDRLSSFFAHSGWFAQYLAILLPMLTLFLLFKFKLKTKIIFMIGLIVIGEVTLILSMQRGAWLTYPPTLLLFWVSIYYVIAKTKEQSITLPTFMKQNWKKVFITIPLTIILSIFVVIAIKDYRKTNEISGANTFMKVTQRASTVANSNDRLLYWPYAYKLWQKSPIYGGGGDSFGWQYKIYYDEKENPFFIEKGTICKGCYGTAHNMYLQNFVGRGIFGLLFLCCFIFILIYKLFYKEINGKNSIEESILSISILGSLIATVIYANVQEIFYSQSVQVIFWVIVFSSMILLDSYKDIKKRRVLIQKWLKRVVILLIVLIPFHILTIYPIKLAILERFF